VVCLDSSRTVEGRPVRLNLYYPAVWRERSFEKPSLTMGAHHINLAAKL
jgi:hypothetical protein